MWAPQRDKYILLNFVSGKVMGSGLDEKSPPMTKLEIQDKFVPPSANTYG